jgi:hypothetical protein
LARPDLAELDAEDGGEIHKGTGNDGEKNYTWKRHSLLMDAEPNETDECVHEDE